MQLLDADAYHPNCYGENHLNVIQKPNLEELTIALESGYSVNVWTCNDKEDIRRLIACGVTGVISDFPNRVKEVIDNKLNRLLKSFKTNELDVKTITEEAELVRQEIYDKQKR